MSRFEEIQQTILTARAQVNELSAQEILTTSEQTITSASSTSKVAQWRLWVWIFAFAIWILEKTVIQNSKNTKEQNLPNLKAAFLDFHNGLELVWDNGWVYDLTNVTDPDSLKIVKNCAILVPFDGGLVVKITGENGMPIPPEAEARFAIYAFKKYVPGIPLQIINKTPDQLKLTINAYVNSEIIDLTTGKQLNISGDVYPVKEAAQAYLNALEFNGSFVKNFFETTIKNAEGVYLCEALEMQWKFDNYDWMDFVLKQIPESGHFELLEENLTINYLSDALVYN